MLHKGNVPFQKTHLTSIIYPIIVIGALSYTGCLIIIYRTKKLLNNPHAWCNWKPYMILEDSKKMLIQDLLQTIESKHSNNKKPTDYISPMVQFLQEIEEESSILRHYLIMNRWTNRIYMNTILPHSFEQLVQEKLDRLDFIKKVFFDWAQSQRSKKIKQLMQ